MDNPILSVIVCTYNGEKYIEDCLSSLAMQTLDSNKFEVIIVNNNSTDNTISICIRYCKENNNFKLISEKKQGLSKARNLGYKTALGDYIAYIDDDAKAEKSWCKMLISAFEGVEPKPIAVGGKVEPYYRIEPPKWFDDKLETFGVKNYSGFYQGVEDKEIRIVGSNMAFKKDVLEEFNGFSEDFGMYGDSIYFGEELELLIRISKKYSNIWCDSNILVYHIVKPFKMKIRNRLIRATYNGKNLYHIASSDKRHLLFLKYFVLFFFYGLVAIISLFPKGISYKTIKFSSLAISKSSFLYNYIIDIFSLKSGEEKL